MSSIGPTLPPHLAAKRKRQAEDAAAHATTPSPQDTPRASSSDADADTDSKRRRVLGPSAPPAPLDERPSSPPAGDESEGSSSDDDDDYGPAPPAHDAHDTAHPDTTSLPAMPEPEKEERKTQRDEWMLVPPTQDDLSARIDPTKLRARKFNTGKGAPGGGRAKDGVNALWTETPEQKWKRLQDEVLGVSQPATAGGATGPSAAELRRQAEAEETARKIRLHNEKYRGQSLVDQHKSKASDKEKGDDPSKRGFDYEKDMGGGATISHTQRKEMMKRTADFSSKFTSGSFS